MAHGFKGFDFWSVGSIAFRRLVSHKRQINGMAREGCSFYGSQEARNRKRARETGARKIIPFEAIPSGTGFIQLDSTS